MFGRLLFFLDVVITLNLSQIERLSYVDPYRSSIFCFDFYERSLKVSLRTRAPTQDLPTRRVHAEE